MLRQSGSRVAITQALLEQTRHILKELTAQALDAWLERQMQP
jgi:hypothetical protein